MTTDAKSSAELRLAEALELANQACAARDLCAAHRDIAIEYLEKATRLGDLGYPNHIDIAAALRVLRGGG
jgi:hypothetical protein